MAHAIGCLGSAVETYRHERAKKARRDSLKRGPVRNQKRKTALAVVQHEGDAHVKLVRVRVGHLHHIQQAYMWANRNERVTYLTKNGQRVER